VRERRTREASSSIEEEEEEEDDDDFDWLEMTLEEGITTQEGLMAPEEGHVYRGTQRVPLSQL